MSESKKISNYPINRQNPFDKNSFLLSDTTFSLNIKKKNVVVKDIVMEYNIDRDEAIEKVVNILSEKLNISKSGKNLFRYIYLNSKYDLESINQKDILPIKIDYKTSMEVMGYNSIQSVYNSILELLDKKIIARTAVEKLYFVNPFFFIPSEKINIIESYNIKDN